jgi:hypothetical protein
MHDENKKKGPSTEPCGTPHFIVRELDTNTVYKTFLVTVRVITYKNVYKLLQLHLL